MKTITSLFALFLAASPYALADQPDAQQAQQQRAMTHRVAEMDRLVEAIHLDLKELKKDHRWLSEYSDKCLWTDKLDQHKSIFYMPKLKFEPGKPQPAQPSQMHIIYSPVNGNDRENDLKGVSVCQFPSLKSKVWAKILKVADAGTAEAIRACIIKQCEGLHKEMKDNKQGKAAIPQQALRGF
jgi:hypothetical protein